MTGLVGTGRLTRLALRRDRAMLVWWVLGVTAYLLATIAAMRGTYPDQSAVDAYAATASMRQTEQLFNGPGHALDTFGGLAVFEVGGYLLPVVALFGILTVVRHTRAVEQNGTAELIGAAPVGRHSLTTAGLLATTAGAFLLGAVTAACFLVSGLEVAGSLVYGVGVGLVVVVFAAVGAVAAQVTDDARTATGIAGAVLGLSYLVRGMGDLNDSALALASPLGWIQALRPFAGERYWPIAATFGMTLALTGFASWLTTRRDVGAGLWATPPGPGEASAALRTPGGLALRLQRGTAISWAVAVLLLALGLGAVGDGVVAATGSLEGVLWAGPDAIDLFYGFAATLLGVLAGAAGTALALRARAEEDAGRTAFVCSGSWSRASWWMRYLAVAMAATGLVVVAAAVGLGAGRAISTGGDIVGTVGWVLAEAPAAWVVAGLAALCAAAMPRWSALAWLVVVYAFVVALLGDLFDLPDWARRLSPFDHVPGPGDTMADLGLIALTIVAALVVGVSALVFRRRDLTAG